jgi:hypothetical protein
MHLAGKTACTFGDLAAVGERFGTPDRPGTPASACCSELPHRESLNVTMVTKRELGVALAQIGIRKPRTA